MRWGKVFKISHNVLHIPEGGDYEAQIFNIKQMLNRSTTVDISTKNPSFGYVLLYAVFLHKS